MHSMKRCQIRSQAYQPYSSTSPTCFHPPTAGAPQILTSTRSSVDASGRRRVDLRLRVTGLRSGMFRGEEPFEAFFVILKLSLINKGDSRQRFKSAVGLIPSSPPVLPKRQSSQQIISCNWGPDNYRANSKRTHSAIHYC